GLLHPAVCETLNRPPRFDFYSENSRKNHFVAASQRWKDYRSQTEIRQAAVRIVVEIFVFWRAIRYVGLD
ncbi:hypothetical protein, partial [Rhodopirellula bahusiensis]|uniref:hypothetical protein n=1 Tax=Rhodopirellula bahusiensis TaxID=2014065 RepID=UPI003299499E